MIVAMKGKSARRGMRRERQHRCSADVALGLPFIREAVA
jgi:hypothetical protein